MGGVCSNFRLISSVAFLSGLIIVIFGVLLFALLHDLLGTLALLALAGVLAAAISLELLDGLVVLVLHLGGLVFPFLDWVKGRSKEKCKIMFRNLGNHR